MNDYLDIIENNGTDDAEQLLRAAQWAIRTGLYGFEADNVVRAALDAWGPENVYMDGEIFFS